MKFKAYNIYINHIVSLHIPFLLHLPIDQNAFTKTFFLYNFHNHGNETLDFRPL